MRKLDPRDPADLAEIQLIIEQIRTDWLREPNIVEIGPAIKITNGIPQINTLAIRFFVREKVSDEECRVRSWRVIPKEIREIPTDVTSTAAVPLQILETRSQRYGDLIGGITIGNTNLTSVGTLAGIFFHNSDGRSVGLSNEHVLVFNIDGQIGDPVAQPSSRFGAQVGIVEAECCPGGQLTFRNVPNPLADTAATIAVVAVIAAAASDEIDPHRRGQEATPVSDGERTLRERVHMKIAYNEVPLPGSAYKLGVDWSYQRETDQKTYTHHVTETRQNAHILREQELITDRLLYRQGQNVYFLAVIGFENNEESCPDYHIVAHAVSPTKTHARRTMLRAARPAELVTFKETFQEFRDENPLTMRCVDFSAFSAGKNFGHNFTHMLFSFSALGNQNLRIVDTMPRPVRDGIGEMIFPDAGVEITLPGVSEEVAADVATLADKPVVLRAFDGPTEVGVETSGTQQGVSYHLRISARQITHIVIEGGGGEGILLKLCATRSFKDHVCYYWGSITLSPMEEIGLWSTYLFVQTVNNVGLGTPPIVAAKTIGGLITSRNFIAADPVTNIAYGDLCPLDAVANGDFEVAAPPE